MNNPLPMAAEDVLRVMQQAAREATPLAFALEIDNAYLAAAALVAERDALREDVKRARQTADYWKAEHLAGNATLRAMETKLAEQAAEIERLRKCNERDVQILGVWAERAQAAERAMGESLCLLAEAEPFIGWTGKPDRLVERIAAFLAANGGDGHG